MPQVRILTSAAGPDWDWQPGDVVEMSVERAAVWADGERGELVRPESTSETPEGNATRRGGNYQTPEAAPRSRR
jgi:hypothetical protein